MPGVYFLSFCAYAKLQFVYQSYPLSGNIGETDCEPRLNRPVVMIEFLVWRLQLCFTGGLDILRELPCLFIKAFFVRSQLCVLLLGVQV